MSTTQSAPSGPVRAITGRHQRSSLAKKSLLFAGRALGGEAHAVIVHHIVLHEIVKRLAGEGVQSRRWKKQLVAVDHAARRRCEVAAWSKRGSAFPAG